MDQQFYLFFNMVKESNINDDTYEIIDRVSIAMVWLQFAFSPYCGPSGAFDWVIFFVLTAKLWCSGTWGEGPVPLFIYNLIYRQQTVVTDTIAITNKSYVLQEKDQQT